MNAVEAPGVAAPARRALAAAGYARLEQLNGVKAGALAPLHGMGPNALRRLAELLKARGWAFAPD